MTVHFIGAGPGAPDLITVRGLNLIKKCPAVLYAGSLVPKDVVSEAPEGAHVIDTAPMNLDEIIEEIKSAHADGKDVARPDWSPDGSLIVFEKIVGNIPRIIAAPVVDGGVRELQVCQEGQLSLRPMGEPTWSPDGS